MSGFYTGPKLFIGRGRDWFYDSRRRILLNNRGRIIRESVNTSIAAKVDASQKTTYSLETASLIVPGPATVIRTQDYDFYHTLIDNLPRLYLLNEFSKNSKETLEILVPGQLNTAEEYWMPRLIPENAVIRLVETNDVVVIQDYIYATPLTRRFKGALPQKYIEFFQKVAFKDRQQPTARKRIFISRPLEAKGGRCITNEKEIFSMMEERGFERHILENLSIPEQVDLFRSAEIVIGAHGAGLSNIIFIEGRASVIELFPGDFLIPHYLYLARSLELDYHWIFSVEKEKDAHFAVDVEQLKQTLNKVLKT